MRLYNKSHEKVSISPEQIRRKRTKTEMTKTGFKTISPFTSFYPVLPRLLVTKNHSSQECLTKCRFLGQTPGQAEMWLRNLHYTQS